jgi:2,3-bisphosphoglycerate-dependent phosphoglycerate mutase
VELLLIRHGLPEHIERDDGLPADPPLSDAGRAQAQRLARWLEPERIDAVYASPLLRARETALPLARARGVRLVIEPGVVELDHLSSIYVPLEQLKAADRERWLELVHGGLYAGVDVPAFRRAVVAALERIVAAHAGQRVAVFCHGGVINVWTAHVLGFERENPLFFDPAYTSVSRFLAAASGERSLKSLNETAHLRDAGA